MFSNELRQLMTDKDLSATELSGLTGIGKSSISQYLSGRNEPTVLRKEEIAVALGLPKNYFTGERVESVEGVPSLTVQMAARLMRKSKDFIYKGLQDGRFPFGWAVLMNSGDWNYYISPIKFTEYTGIEVP